MDLNLRTVHFPRCKLCFRKKDLKKITTSLCTILPVAGLSSSAGDPGQGPVWSGSGVVRPGVGQAEGRWTGRAAYNGARAGVPSLPRLPYLGTPWQWLWPGMTYSLCPHRPWPPFVPLSPIFSPGALSPQKPQVPLEGTFPCGWSLGSKAGVYGNWGLTFPRGSQIARSLRGGRKGVDSKTVWLSKWGGGGDVQWVLQMKR